MSDRTKGRLYVLVFWILLAPLLLTSNWFAVVAALAFFFLGTLCGIAVWREHFRQLQQSDIALWRAEKKSQRQKGSLS